MKTLFFALGLAFYLAAPAMAQRQPTFEVGYSSAAVQGITVATTATLMNTARPTGFLERIAGYRIQNQDANYAIWCGYNSSVSATAYNANLGVKLAAGASAVFMVGKVSTGTNTLIPIYCLAESGAGGGGVSASLEWFAY